MASHKKVQRKMREKESMKWRERDIHGRPREQEKRKMNMMTEKISIRESKFRKKRWTRRDGVERERNRIGENYFRQVVL